MNLSYSRREKIIGFTFFLLVWMAGAGVLWIRCTELMYPVDTKIAVCVVPLVIRLVFDMKTIFKVVKGHDSVIFK